MVTVACFLPGRAKDISTPPPTRKNTEALVASSEVTALEVNADKTKYMVLSRDQNAGRSQNIKTDN